MENYMRELSVDGDHPIIHIEQYYELEQVLEKLYQISMERTEYAKCKQIELIYRFFSFLLQNSTKQSEHDMSESAKIIIDYNFFRAITVREIAHTLHMDSAYLTRIFTQKYGIAPKEYLIDRRIEYAKKLLRESDASIKEIAISVGYDDQLYFSRIFKKKEGLPPLEYRRKLK